MTLDPDLVETAARAVADGAAVSLSAWVNDAMAERARRDARRDLLRDAIADYEAEFGAVTADEIDAQRRADRAQARVVRGRVAAKRRAKRP